jgi:excisionase family DNA binding protein
METLYKVKEAARILKVHEGTVRHWLMKGKLRYVKVGKSTRIREADLKELIEEPKRKPGLEEKKPKAKKKKLNLKPRPLGITGKLTREEIYEDR